MYNLDQLNYINANPILKTRPLFDHLTYIQSIIPILKERGYTFFTHMLPNDRLRSIVDNLEEKGFRVDVEYQDPFLPETRIKVSVEAEEHIRVSKSTRLLKTKYR